MTAVSPPRQLSRSPEPASDYFDLIPGFLEGGCGPVYPLVGNQVGSDTDDDTLRHNGEVKAFGTAPEGMVKWSTRNRWPMVGRLEELVF